MRIRDTRATLELKARSAARLSQLACTGIRGEDIRYASLDARTLNTTISPGSLRGTTLEMRDVDSGREVLREVYCALDLM